MVRYYGRDLTGRCLDDEMTTEGFGWVVESYRDCARASAPRYFQVPALSFNGTVMPLARLMLPCGRGDAVDTIIVGIYPAR